MRVVHRSPRLKLSNCVRHNISLSSSSPLWPALLYACSPVQWSICSIGPGPRQLFATIILNLKWPPARDRGEREMKMKTLQTPSPSPAPAPSPLSLRPTPESGSSCSLIPCRLSKCLRCLFWTCSRILVGDTALQPGQPQFIGIKRFSVKILDVVVLIAWDAVTVTVTVTVTVAVVVKAVIAQDSSNNLWQSSSFSHQMKIESSSPSHFSFPLLTHPPPPPAHYPKCMLNFCILKQSSRVALRFDSCQFLRLPPHEIFMLCKNA